MWKNIRSLPTTKEKNDKNQPDVTVLRSIAHTLFCGFQTAAVIKATKKSSIIHKTTLDEPRWPQLPNCEYIVDVK